MASGKNCPGDTVKLLTAIRTSRLAQLLLIVVVGLTGYSSSFQVPFVFDDFDMIVFNPDVIGGKPLLNLLLHGTARRIADISFAVNYRLHGEELFGYHLTNLVIHLGSAALVYLLCHILLDSTRPVDESETPAHQAAGRYLPVAAALLFVSHPLQTQAVTYIVQRHTSLATLFYLLAMCAYLKGRQLFEQSALTSRLLPYGGVFLAAALLGGFTKQIAYSLPLLILVSEVLLFRGRLLKQYLLLAGVAVFLMLIVLFLPVTQGGAVADVIYNLRHATAETIYLPRTSYLLTQLRVVAVYLRLLVLPVGQNLDYEFPLSTSCAEPAVLAAAALHAALMTLAVVLQRRATRIPGHVGQQLRLIAFGICWFYAALLIESSVIPITDVIMEHRVYLPSVGFFIAIGAAVELAGFRFGQVLRARWLVLGAVCALLTAATVVRNRLWSNDVAFWEDVAHKSPRKGRVLGNLSSAYLNVGRYEEALRMDVAAIRLDPSLERAWSRLGTLLEHIPALQGRFTTGREYLTAQERVDFRWLREHNSVTFNNMGLACEYLNSPTEAYNWYFQAVQMNEKSALAWFNLGLLAKKHGNTATAGKALERLAMLNPVLGRQLADY